MIKSTIFFMCILFSSVMLKMLATNNLATPTISFVLPRTILDMKYKGERSGPCTNIFIDREYACAWILLSVGLTGTFQRLIQKSMGIVPLF